MKILDRKQFLALPSGVLYSDFRYSVMEGLYIKYDTTAGGDWVKLSFLDSPFTFTEDYSDIHEIYEKSHKEGASFIMDYDCTVRDGLYEEDDLFAVYEKEDLIKLIEFLNECVPNYPKINK